jgi:5-methylcytosine-specific restriction endonuclease McrA
MRADDLIEFVQRKMKMSHVYQPLIIRALAQSGGRATVRQLASSLLLEDESQIRYYEDRIKKMPLPVLKRNGIVGKDGDLVSLVVPDLSYPERASRASRIGAFLERREIATWDYRLIETDPVPTDVLYRVLAAAKGLCALCGVESSERRIEVDHIVPRSRGGSNDIENLQALCDECNRGKSNRDDADFRRQS